MDILDSWYLPLFQHVTPGRGGGGGVLWISSDGDDQRIFLGFEIFDSGIFLGRKIWRVFVWVACFN